MLSTITYLNVHRGLSRAAIFCRSAQSSVNGASGNSVIQGGKKTWHAICKIHLEALMDGAGCRQTGNSY